MTFRGAGLEANPTSIVPAISSSHAQADGDAKAAQAALASLVLALNRLLAKLDEKSKAALLSRTFALGDKTTLQELANRFELTRERIRQIEVKAEKKLRFRLGQQENRVFRDASQRLREQLGMVAPFERFQTMSKMLLESEITREHTFLLPLLFWAAGPYERYQTFVVRAPSDKLISSTTRLLRKLTRRGPIKAEAAMQELTQLGIAQTIQHSWILAIGEFRFVEGHLAYWGGNIGDKAEIVLRLRGSQMTLEEISCEINGDHSIRTLANRLVSDSRFSRTDPDHFALREWGLDEYSSIVEELVTEIKDNGGEAAANYLVSTIASKFGVSEVSVKTYLGSPRFVRTDRGTIRVRTKQESFTIDKKIELTKRCYRLSRGWAYRITVDEELLRGSGRSLPAAFAVQIGLAPLRSVELSSQFGSIRLNWPVQQGTISSLRRIAEELGGALGDYLFIEFVPKSRLEFMIVGASQVRSASGLERLQLETGSVPEIDRADALRRIACALGLEKDEASITAIRRRLRIRSEDDLLPFLPEDFCNDQQALRELLDLVSG